MPTPSAPLPKAARDALSEIVRLRRMVGEAISRYETAMDAPVTAEPATIRTPRDVWNLCAADMSGLDQETFRVLVLNSKNRVIDNLLLYQGTINGSMVRAAEVFRQAIVLNGLSIVCVHNHPSGDPTPSPEDVAVTASIRAAGKVLDVELLDHVIIGQKGNNAQPFGFISMKERGLGF